MVLKKNVKRHWFKCWVSTSVFCQGNKCTPMWIFFLSFILMCNFTHALHLENFAHIVQSKPLSRQYSSKCSQCTSSLCNFHKCTSFEHFQLFSTASIVGFAHFHFISTSPTFRPCTVIINIAIVLKCKMCTCIYTRFCVCAWTYTCLQHYNWNVYAV